MLFKANCFYYFYYHTVYIDYLEYLWRKNSRQEKIIYLERWELGSRQAVLSILRSCMRDDTSKAAHGRAHSLPAPGRHLLLCPTSEGVHTPYHAGWCLAHEIRLDLPVLCMCRDMAAQTSLKLKGLGRRGSIWFMGKEPDRKEWLLYQIMLCGSPGRKCPGASQSQMT